MPRVLIVLAHPALEKSRVHSRLFGQIPDSPGLTLHDLYEEYPTFAVDVSREQALLIEHDIIVWQHPLYWYSTPPLLKQWIDLVMEHGWAYGSDGNALHGKRVVSVVTAGGGAVAYTPDGYNRFTIRQFLAPLEQTCRLCGMHYAPPYVIYGTHSMTASDIDREAQRYGTLLEMLLDGRLDLERTPDLEDLNRILTRLEGAEGVL